MRAATLHQAVRPTARAIAWTPVLGLAVGLLAVAGLFRLGDESSDAVLGMGAGALSAALVLSWRDAAAGLLAPVPVSRFARRLLRLGLVALVAVPVGLLVATVLPGDDRMVAPLLALTGTGVAVATWLPVERDVTLAAAVPLVWVCLAEMVGGLTGPVGDAATLWRTDPWPVLALALVVLVAGRRR